MKHSVLEKLARYCLLEGRRDTQRMSAGSERSQSRTGEQLITISIYVGL